MLERQHYTFWTFAVNQFKQLLVTCVPYRPYNTKPVSISSAVLKMFKKVCSAKKSDIVKGTCPKRGHLVRNVIAHLSSP